MKKVIFSLMVVGFVTLTTVQAQVVTANNEKIAGSPYLDDAYTDGVIYYANKELAAPIRYNAYQDLIEYKANGRPLVLDPDPAIKRVVVGNTTFVPMTFTEKGKSKVGYFALLTNGDLSLYVRRAVVFLPAKTGGALDGSDQPAQFKRAIDSYYFQVGSDALQEMNNIKSLISQLPSHQDEMARYAKKEKISPRKENEVIQLVQHYNNL
jgi:hypothetical protein